MSTSLFVVGEVVSSKGIWGSCITFEVLEILENKNLRVKLTEVNLWWSDRGFAIGQEHVLKWKNFLGRDTWSFTPPVSQLFFLTIQDGQKVLTI